jgi:hypothetical protein
MEEFKGRKGIISMNVCFISILNSELYDAKIYSDEMDIQNLQLI